MKADISQGWAIPNEFNLYASWRRKSGIRYIESIIAILTGNSVCIDQKERISLKHMAELLISVENYLKAI